MRKFFYAIIAVIGLGVISCSHNNQKNEGTAYIEEEEIGCLCCPVEEAPADTLDNVDWIPLEIPL